MKNPFKRIIAAITAVTLVAGSVPLNTIASAQLAPVETAGHGMLSSVSEEYIGYMHSGEDDKAGNTPSMLDVSYLGESYAQLTKTADEKFPSSYDLRDHGRVSPVENQSPYGTCWGFASLGSIESQLITQFTDISFSKKHLVWNAYENDYMREFFNGVRSKEDFDNPYDMGGFDSLATATLAEWNGPVYSYRLPYDKDDTDEHLTGESDFHLTDVYFATANTYITDGYDNILEKDISEKIIKELVSEYGASTISYCSDDAYYNNEYYTSFCYDENKVADHAVSVVGWDDDFSREKFGTSDDTRPEKDGAWLIKNSWGANWGDDGYFWLSYEDPTIGWVAKYIVDSKDNYSNYYGVGKMWSLNASADTFYKDENAKKYGYMSNIFTAKGDEQLEAVSFYTTDVNTQYEITVYTDTDKENPVSGSIALSSQAGTEKYPGYHTVELDKAVALTSGENFSVVVKLTNPRYGYPLPVEIYYNGFYNSSPEYSDDGRVSMYSENGKDWNDVSELSYVTGGYTLCATGFCLSAFTNPLPESKTASENVRFSIIEGPVALGSKLELSGADEIWYSIDGGAAIHYTKPIVIEKECTVSAWSKTDGRSGNIVSRTYTKAKSALTEYAVKYGAKKLFVTPDMFGEDTEVTLPAAVSGVSIRPRGSDVIIIDGKTAASDEWSEEIELTAGESRDIVITSSADGKDKTEYTIHVSKQNIGYDTDKETIKYDESRYIVKDKDGNILANGDSLSDFTEQKISVYNKDNELIATETTPKRYTIIPDVKALVYNEEKTLYTFSDKYICSYNPDMSDAVALDEETIPLTPGKNIYLQRIADINGFASDILCIDVPERPAAPENVKTKSGINNIGIDGDGIYEFRLQGQDTWTGDNEYITELASNAEYTIEVRKKATDDEFASEVATIKVKTLKGVIIPVYFYYNGTVVLTDEKHLTTLGESVIEYDEKELGNCGYVFVGKNKATVNVTEKDGAYVAQKDFVAFNIKPAVDNSDKKTHVVYCDAFTEEVIEENTISYADCTIFNIDNLDCPEGYGYYQYEQRSSKDYITRLLYIDGKWHPADSEIVVPVEKLPAVNVKIVDENGNKVYEYSKYVPYGKYDAKAEIPEGYTAVGDVDFAVSVTRGENGRLVSNISEFVVTVRKNADEPTAPDDPGKPGKPSELEKPDEPTEPAKPAVPEEPTEPVKPAVPEEPTEPAKPAVPEEPAEPAKPTVPEEPTEPAKPAVPEEPTEPAKPANPDTSGEMPFATAVTPVIAVALMTCVIISGRRKK
mgnify:FL=1